MSDRVQVDPMTVFFLEHTAVGRRFQRRVLPKSALMPNARREAEQEERDEEFRRGVPGGYPTRRR